MLWNTCNGKTCHWWLMPLMLKFSWEMLFFKSGDTEVVKADRNKLFASTKRQMDNHTLMLHILHSYMSVVCTYHCRGLFKKIFFFTQGNLQGGRVEDHRMMFTTAIIYWSSTLHIYNWLHDVFNPLHSNIRMHILHTVLYTFPDVLARRICLTIKRLFSWLSFPLFSWP